MEKPAGHRQRRPTADRDRAIILLVLDAGLRASELCGVTFGDINLTANSIKVLGKGQKECLVYFGKRTAKALWKLLTPRLKDSFEPLRRLLSFSRHDTICRELGTPVAFGIAEPAAGPTARVRPGLCIQSGVCQLFRDVVLSVEPLSWYDLQQAAVLGRQSGPFLSVDRCDQND